MSQPYIGEIRMFGGNFPPAGWAFCNGQLINISENDALFNLIGTTYGGDGQTTFALPNLQSRVPLHQGTGAPSTYTLGESGGVEAVTLNTNQIPVHTHPALCSSGGGSTTSNPAGGVWTVSDVNQYANAAPDATMGTQPIQTSSDGGSQPHDNMIPFLCVSYIISLFGIFPTQN